jgi:hypothetical protein
MCKCKCKGATSSKGAKGDPGTNGLNGIFGGYSSNWVFDSGTSDSPGLTELRLNNLNPTLATKLYVNTTNAESDIIAAFIASFYNGGSFGYIRLFNEFDSPFYSYYEITAMATPSSSVYAFDITYIDGSVTTSFSDASSVVLTFTPNGIDGIISLDYSYTTDNTKPYIFQDDIAYQEMATIMYKGSNHYVVSPSSIKVVAKLKLTFVKDFGYIQIYDVTNSVIIGTTASIASSTKAIINVPITGAIPAGEAIWEIRMRMAGEADQNTLLLYSLNIDF